MRENPKKARNAALKTKVSIRDSFASKTKMGARDVDIIEMLFDFTSRGLLGDNK